MYERILTNKKIQEFKVYLQREEKSDNTIEKYMRDTRAFAEFLCGAKIGKELVIRYKDKLISEGYAARSINSMLASLNSFFAFLGW